MLDRAVCGPGQFQYRSQGGEHSGHDEIHHKGSDQIASRLLLESRRENQGFGPGAEHGNDRKHRCDHSELPQRTPRAKQRHGHKSGGQNNAR
jgi:hypothetical protein